MKDYLRLNFFNCSRRAGTTLKRSSTIPDWATPKDGCLRIFVDANNSLPTVYPGQMLEGTTHTHGNRQFGVDSLSNRFLREGQSDLHLPGFAANPSPSQFGPERFKEEFLSHPDENSLTRSLLGSDDIPIFEVKIHLAIHS